MLTNLLTWIVLLALSLLSYFSAESAFGDASTTALIVASATKCVLVGFQFMDLRKAHVFWKMAFVSLISLFSGFSLVII